MIESGKIVTQTLAFQKTLFENSFNAMIMIQEQTEKMVTAFLTQLPWVPEDGKKTMGESVKMYKDARDNFKKAVDDGFVKMEEMFVQR